MISVKGYRTKTRRYLQGGAKTIIFLFWASLYIMVMRITIFESRQDPPVKKWWGVKDHRFKTPIPAVDDIYSDPENYWPGLENIPIIEAQRRAWSGEAEAEKLQIPVFGEDVIEPGPEIDWPEPQNITIIELQRRATRVEAVCRRRAINKTLNSKEFFVDYVNNLVWCNIFKAASSSWLYNFNLLGGYDRKFLARSRMNPLMLARRKFPRPSPEELREAVNTPEVISLLIVREPFVRLLSAYRDKLEGKAQPFYKKLAKAIVKEQRHKAAKALGPLKSPGPTFYEFVAYLIQKHKEKNTTFDEHWAPYYQFCSPCAVNFSVIAKVETLSRDSGYVIYHLGLAHVLGRRVVGGKTRQWTVMNRSKDGKNTTALLKFYFGQIDETMLYDLLKIYGIDFEMFGYDPMIYTRYVRKKKSSSVRKV